MSKSRKTVNETQEELREMAASHAAAATWYRKLAEGLAPGQKVTEVYSTKEMLEIAETCGYGVEESELIRGRRHV